MEAMTSRTPDLLDRLWYRKVREEVPALIFSKGSRHPRVARLVPQGWSWFHRAYSRLFGLGWSLCALCAAPYPGYQGGVAIPDPTREATAWVVICLRCTITRHKALNPKEAH